MKKRIYRKIMASLITLIMVSTSCIMGFAAEMPVKADEKSNTYIEIHTAEDLNRIRNDLDGKYILMNDIRFSAEDFQKNGKFYNNGEGWLPIGQNETEPFSGVFDGNGHKIDGLVINTSQLYAGLFGYSKGIIKDLTMCNSVITSTAENAYIGEIVGYSEEVKKAELPKEPQTQPEEEKNLSMSDVDLLDNNDEDESFTQSMPNLLSKDSSMRLSGQNRYETAMKVADALKKNLGVSKFDNIVVVSGLNYPDGISATWLAKVKNAPILLVEGTLGVSTRDYINANLNPQGTVYIVGGTGVVSKQFEASLNNFHVERYGGKDRYDTNLILLKEMKAETEDEILVCSGNDFADALSASAVGKPIMLVDHSIGKVQKKYIKTIGNKKYFLIGGRGAVSSSTENYLRQVGTIERLDGINRFETSELVVRKFFPGDRNSMVLAYGLDFPDGLVGGVLAAAMNSPIVLVSEYNYEYAVRLKSEKNTSKITVLGGPTLISGILAPERKKGIDVSTFQNDINWSAVKKSGIEFAFIRVGGRFGASGRIYEDDYFDRNMQGADRNGIDTGVYFFTQAVNENEAIEEARYTCSKLRSYNVTYPVVIDTENLSGGRHSNISREQRTRVVKAFCDEVRRQGYTPMIYANLYWLNHYLDMSRLSQYKLWVAQYNSTCDYRGNYNCWQYTSSGSVAGINGRVDMDIWY